MSCVEDAVTIWEKLFGYLRITSPAVPDHEPTHISKKDLPICQTNQYGISLVDKIYDLDKELSARICYYRNVTTLGHKINKAR